MSRVTENVFQKNLTEISGFDYIPEGWEAHLIQDIFEIGRGRVISQNEINEHPGNYPVYSSQSFNNGVMGTIDTFDFEGEYLTWTTDGAYAGTVFHRTGKFSCTNVCGTLKANEKKVFTKFFLYHLGKISKRYVSYIGNPKLMNDIMANIAITVPSLSTQRDIVRILSTCDGVIEKTQAAIAKYKAIKQGMLHDLFTRGIDITTGKLRPKYEDTPDLYKESKLGMVPNEWEEKTIGEVCSMKSGEGITSKSISEIEDYPVYGGNGLRGFTSSFTHEGEYILVGRQGALCGNVTRVRGKFYASEHAVVVTVENEINVDWLFHQLEDKNLNQYSEASAQPGLSVNKILKLPIIKPSFDEQNKIAERLLSIDQKHHTEQTYLQKLQQLKAGLMGDLLSGKKVVKVPVEAITQTEN
ncbi:MAG: restriction endonuclease subunit S [Proteobacteria bacterium]|nr:restriction endonuclease subunit S [Pseudomonadota bacterium]